MEGSSSDPPFNWNSPVAETGLEESMWRLGLGSRDSYPERPGETDCDYYLRTGFCGYGPRCRFNHPRGGSVVLGAVRAGGGEYPERVGQPVCEYYLRTGTCKFGASCKYHHPRCAVDPASLNYYGYPLRPGEIECSYYVKTGQCKFGVTCKFHHPQPDTTSAPPFYSTVQPPSVPFPQPYGEVAASWQVARPLLLPGSYVQGAYSPVLLPPGLVPFPGWSPYPASVSPVASPGSQLMIGAGQVYGVTQLSPSATAYTGSFSTLLSSPCPSSSTQKEQVFPERHGQPECQYYMRNGDCKFGSTCKYHHPPERIMPRASCVLSPMGLPLRPGAPPCTFFAQHGVCKFGPTCKFDHPMGTLSYSPSASSLVDMPVAPYPIGSSPVTLALPSPSSDPRPEFSSGPTRDPFSTRIPSSLNTSSNSLSLLFSKSGTAFRSNVQLSGQASSPSSGGEVSSSS